MALLPTVTKPHGDFWFRDKRTGLSGSVGNAECLRRESEHVCVGACMNAMHAWEVVLAGFEINDLDVFSGRESSQRKCADKSSRGTAVTARMGRQKFSFQKKEGQTENALVKKRHAWRTPLLIQTWELWAQDRSQPFSTRDNLIYLARINKPSGLLPWCHATYGRFDTCHRGSPCARLLNEQLCLVWLGSLIAPHHVHQTLSKQWNALWWL